MITGMLHKRQSDDFGSGAFGASRGSKTHRGIDYACTPKTKILSPIVGRITKLGYPYNDDLNFRYVEIADLFGFYHRLFYVVPCVSVGDRISRDTVVGVAQDIAKRYDFEHKKMNNHIHYEVIKYTGAGKVYYDPENYGTSDA